MLNYSKSAKHTGTQFLRKFIYGMSLPAHAEEVKEETPPDNKKTEATIPPVDIEALLTRVRREEKDKLYGKISKLETDNATLKESNNTYLMKMAALQEALEKAQSAPDKEKELKEKITTLTSEIETLKSSAPDEKTIRAEITAEFEIAQYAKDQLTANKDTILSMLASDIKGATKEEVDAAVKTAQEKTLSIKKDLGLVDDAGAPVPPKPDKKKTEDKKPPLSNPPADDNEDLDLDYLKTLSVGSKEYAEFRKKMGLH